MQLHSLVKITKRRQKRLGQGYGSGRGKTAGRGTKGQKARSSIPLWFEGGGQSLIKRLPFLRGKGKNKVFREKSVVLKLSELNKFKKGAVVDIKALVSNRLIEEKYAKNKVKILADGKINVPLTIKVSLSKGAKEKIEKSGGKIIK